MRALLPLAALTLGAWTAHRQISTSFKSATGVITVTAVTAEVKDFQGNHAHYLLTGSAVVTDTGQGATLSGDSIDAQMLKLPKSLYALQSALVIGHGHLVLDSVVSDAAAKEAAQKAGKPYVAPTETQITKADSNSFSFQAVGSEGTITIPGPWTCHQNSKGTKPSDDKKSTVAYVGSFDASGSSGLMHVFLKQDGSYDKPKSGHISGPVKFRWDRTETDPAKDAPTVTGFTGSCDSVDMDFTTTPGTVTANGHVIIDGGDSSGFGHTTCDRCVIYVDKDLHPIRYVLISGAAAVTPKEGSH